MAKYTTMYARKHIYIPTCMYVCKHIYDKTSKYAEWHGWEMKGWEKRRGMIRREDGVWIYWDDRGERGLKGIWMEGKWGQKEVLLR